MSNISYIQKNQSKKIPATLLYRRLREAEREAERVAEAAQAEAGAPRPSRVAMVSRAVGFFAPWHYKEEEGKQ